MSGGIDTSHGLRVASVLTILDGCAYLLESDGYEMTELREMRAEIAELERRRPRLESSTKERR